MATVNGYTAEKMQEIIDQTVSGAHITGDDLILELHGGGTVNAGDVRGPEGAPGSEAPVDGKIYSRKDGAWIPTSPNTGFDVQSGPATPQNVSSTTGVDWSAGTPLDVALTKIGDAAESYILVHIGWSGTIALAGWCGTWGGVRVGGVDHWGQVAHQMNLPSHFEFHDVLVLTGLAAGAATLRARIKLVVGSEENYIADVADFFSIEYEEVYV